MNRASPCAICWDRTVICRDAEHAKVTAARTARRGRTWGSLVVRKEDGSTRVRTIDERMTSKHPAHCEVELFGGDRHYLYDRPVHCGDRLLLQHETTLTDDFGEFSSHPDLGTLVRYEVEHVKRDGVAVRIPVMYVREGGHSFSTLIDINHYFRWPES